MLSSTQFSVRSHHFRHALLEAQVDHFISNDTISGPGGNNSRVMLITGPNACGKSIYLKQVRYICGTITRTFTRMFEFSLFTEEMFDVLPKRLWLMSFKKYLMDDCGITNCLAYLQIYMQQAEIIQSHHISYRLLVINLFSLGSQIVSQLWPTFLSFELYSKCFPF